MANGNYSPTGGYRGDRSRQDQPFPRDDNPYGARAEDERYSLHDNPNNQTVRSSNAGYGEAHFGESRFGGEDRSAGWRRENYRADPSRGRQQPEYRFGERQDETFYSDAGARFQDGRRQSGGYDPRGYDENRRGFMARASDEVASWFGDDAAGERRAMDEHRGKGPKGYKRSDSRISEDVNDRLSDDPMLDASNISVTVKDAEVTLNGSVSSRVDKRRAEDIVDAISGVSHVQNNLRVSLSGSDPITGSTTV